MFVEVTLFDARLTAKIISVPRSSKALVRLSPFLPPEILDRIIKETMRINGAMLHVFNRVSSGFKALTAAHLPWLYFRPEVAEELELDERYDIHICVKAIIKEARKGSGLFFQVKRTFWPEQNVEDGLADNAPREVRTPTP